MSNALAAIDALLSLTQLSMRIVQATNEIGTTLALAQSEGRDLTEDEVKAVQDKRQAAVDEWNKGTPT